MCILLSVVLILSCDNVVGLNCYQCTSMTDRGCFDYNLKKEYLRECDDKTSNPVCRSISQVQYFTPGQEVVIFRECAYIHEERLECVLSKFSGLHYSMSCECDVDGCNRASNVRGNWFLLAFVWLSFTKRNG